MTVPIVSASNFYDPSVNKRDKIYFNPKYKKALSPEVIPPKIEYPVINDSFCYWTVADGEHAFMCQTMINSARKCGVKEDFHVWTDRKLTGKNVFNHECGTFDKHKYLFKFHFLQREVQKLGYKYYVFLDADNFFCKHPGTNMLGELVRNNQMFCQLESLCTGDQVRRADWWGIPLSYYPLLLWYKGVQSKSIYNTNAGFWIVKHEFIEEFCSRGLEFWSWCKENIKLEFTEEAPLAWLGHFVSTPELNTFAKTKHVWGSDWTSNFVDALPSGQDWVFEDYMSGAKEMVNPAIVHCMRAKKIMVENGK